MLLFLLMDKALNLLNEPQTHLCRPTGYGEERRTGTPTPLMVFGRRQISRPKIENFT